MSHVVLVHDEMGVYLGHCMGLGFWTMLDDVGQDTAVCFDDEAAAREYIKSSEAADVFTGVRTVRVKPDVKESAGAYISFEELRKQGLADYVCRILH